MVKITKKMKIAEVVEKYPATKAVFLDIGLACIGCVAAEFESLEEGLMAHGLEVDEVIEKLNEAANNK
ncbi:MAG: DUF1858 domain-containing protein [Patescibacteria group bacterium]